MQNNTNQAPKTKFTTLQIILIVAASLVAAIALIALIVGSLAYSNTQNNPGVFGAINNVNNNDNQSGAIEKLTPDIKTDNVEEIPNEKKQKMVEKTQKLIEKTPIYLNGKSLLTSDVSNIDLFKKGKSQVQIEINCITGDIIDGCLFSNAVGNAGQFTAYIENSRFIVKSFYNSTKLENTFVIQPNFAYKFTFGISNNNLWSSINAQSLEFIKMDLQLTNADLPPNFITLGGYRKTLFTQDNFFTGYIQSLNISMNNQNVLCFVFEEGKKSFSNQLKNSTICNLNLLSF